MEETKILTRDEILEKAPVAFQTIPASTTSGQYNFISTIEMVEKLEKLNWNVVDAKQTKSKKRNGFQKHMITLQNPDIGFSEVGQSIPRLLLVNSHDGFNAFNLNLGIHELVCSNGLIISKEVLDEIRVLHKGLTLTEVEKNVWEYIKHLPEIEKEVLGYKAIQLDSEAKKNFANKALEIRFTEKKEYPLLPEQLLEPRRVEDDNNTLWKVFNVVQENIIKAGIPTMQKGRKVKAINGLNNEIDINKQLWNLMAGTYQMFK